MMKNKYIGVYYSDSHFKDLNAFTTFSLFFDEIHLITHSTTLTGNNPTNYFKNLPDEIQIAFPKNVNEIEISRLKDLTQFLVNNKALLGDILFYHNDLLGGSISKFSQRLLEGSVPVEELIKFINGDTEEKQKFDKFKKENSFIEDSYQLSISSTAYHLASKNNWILFGDKSDIKLPFMESNEKNVKLFSSLLAEECLKIVLPRTISLNAEDILYAREKLKTELIPFRMTLQKLTSLLRDGIKNCKSIDEFKSEAKFIAESKVEPALNEIVRRIEIEKNKLWVRIFGKVLNWIPLVAKSFFVPSPDNLFKTLERVYSDVGDVAKGINEFNLAKEPGLSFLLKTDEIINKDSI